MATVKPRVIILIGAFWPGHESAGPNLSVKAMCESLSDQVEFFLVARDRPFGAAEPMVANNEWRDLGWAKIHYLSVGSKGAEGLAELLRDTPHENETTIIIAVRRSKAPCTAPALDRKRQENVMLAGYAVEQRIDERDLLAVHLRWDVSQTHSSSLSIMSLFPVGGRKERSGTKTGIRN